MALSHPGVRIRNLRKGLRLSQSRFADILNVTQATVSAWEHGDPKRAPSHGAFFRLGSLAPSLADRIYFWGLGGLREQAIVKMADELRELPNAHASAGEIAPAPSCSPTAQGTDGSGADTSLRSIFIPEPDLKNLPAAGHKMAGEPDRKSKYERFLADQRPVGHVLVVRTGERSFEAFCLEPHCHWRDSDFGRGPWVIRSNATRHLRNHHNKKRPFDGIPVVRMHRHADLTGDHCPSARLSGNEALAAVRKGMQPSIDLFKLAADLLPGPRPTEAFGEMLDYSGTLSKFFTAVLETLTVIGCWQPITQEEIEKILQADCKASLRALLELGLISTAGRKGTRYRPILYRIKRKLYHTMEPDPSIPEEAR